MFALKFLFVLLCLSQVFAAHHSHELSEEHDAQVPVILNSFSCSGSSHTCRAQLKFAGNQYWASWDVTVNTNPPRD